MTTALHLHRQRRVLVLIAATVLLHYIAIDWAGTQLGAPAQRALRTEPAPIVAALHAPPPVTEPQTVARPAAPRGTLARSRPAAVAEAVVAPEAAVIPEAPTAQAEAGAADSVPEVQSAAQEEATPEAAPAPEPVAGPRYKVRLPPPAELTLDVERTDAKGATWSGQAVMAWSRSGDAYRMSMVASITMLVTLNLVELTSEGTVGAQGIVPRTMTEKRRNRAPTATHFNQEQGRITFSASQGSHPLAPGAQDKATFPMQLAGIGRADPAQFGADIELLVGEDKDASLFRFQLAGQEEIDTGMGRLATWRLTRPPRPGSYSSRLDVWLAPGQNWYPVQIRSTEANGAVTTQTIRKIVVKESGT